MTSETARPTRRPLSSLRRCSGLSLAGAALLTLSGGCGGDPFWLPRAHKIEVQQGNLVSEAQRAKLNTGMSRQQVIAILGHPVQEPGFRPDRWDYIYTRTPAGDTTTARKLTIVFENELVSEISDNQDEHSGELPLRRPWWQRNSDTGGNADTLSEE